MIITRNKLVIVIACGISLVLIVIGTLLLLQPTATLPNRPPTTGVTLIFSPPLANATNLEIESSDGHKKTIVMALAKEKGPNSIVVDPKGATYNISMDEGVYRLKIHSTGNSFPTFTKTATVSKNKVTTEIVNFAGSAR